MSAAQCHSLFTIFTLAFSAAIQNPRVSHAEGPATQPDSRPLRVEFVEPAPVQPQFAAPSTIFLDDFTDTRKIAARYFEYTTAKDSFGPDPAGGYANSPAMKQTFDEKQVTGGTLKVLFGKSPWPNKALRPTETFREIYWRLYLKHEAGWEGNPAKLARATCLCENWTQGLMAHVWSGKPGVLCIDPATGITNSEKISIKYNDFDHLHWLGCRHGTTPIFTAAESGRWVCVESHIALNTPGKKDGIFELFIDGKLEAEHHDLDWHGTWQKYAIDAVFFENYWNEGSLKKQSRWFDNIIIATAPIGPITSSAMPTIHFTRTVPRAAVEISADPEAKTIVWQGAATTTDHLTISPATGTFEGPLATAKKLTEGTLYWIRLQEPNTPWSPTHHPFRTPSATK